MFLKEVLPRIDFDNRFVYKKQFELSSRTDSEEQELVIGDLDFAYTHIVIAAVDSDGDDIGKQITPSDTFKIEMADADGHGQQNDPIDLFSLNANAEMFPIKGTFKNRLRQKITVSGGSFPAAAKLTYPVRVSVEFHGYKLTPESQMQNQRR